MLPTDKSNALSVETAGYAILAMMTQDPEQHILNARKVVKWITTKRNGLGGFFSTQVSPTAVSKHKSHDAIPCIPVLEQRVVSNT